MASSTSTTSTSVRRTASISPKDIQQLHDYQEYHRSKQKQINHDSPKIDSFLKRYIKNDQVLNLKNADYSKDIYSKYLSNNLKSDYKQKKYNKDQRSAIPRRRSRALSVYDQKSSTSTSNHTTPTLGQYYNRDVQNQLQQRASNYVNPTSLKVDTPQARIQKFVKVVPKDFVACDVSDLIVLVSRMLENLISLNNKLVPDSIINGGSEENKKNSLLTRYHSRTPPNISVINYLSRLTKFNNFSTANLLTCIYYIDLLSYNYQPFFTLNSWTVHRFLLVATMVSQKSMEDYFFTNEHYAKVGGVALNELNYLEIDFLQRINWKCIPSRESSIRDSKDVLDLYYKQLIELMGENCHENESVYVFEGSDIPQHVEARHDPQYESNTNYHVNENKEFYSVDKSKFNKNGYSTDASSSPHLKRRHPNL